MSTETEEMQIVPEGETIPTKQLAPFDSFKEQIEKLNKTAETLVVTDVNDKVGMALARTTRLAYKDIRVEITHRHKELKADILVEGNRLDKAKRDMLATIEKLEEGLLEQEQFAERQEAKELAEEIQRRTTQLVPFWNQQVPLPDLGKLTDREFEIVLQDAETTHNAKIEAARKLEEDRIAKEKADAEDRERVRLENVRLKEEAAQREAEAKKEREKQEAEQQQREDALSEIQGIQQQVMIARVGRLGVRKGGTVECMRETLQETEKWDISEKRFGALTAAAQAAKDSAVAAIRDMFATEIRRIGDEEKAAEELTKVREAAQKERERLAEEQRAAAEEFHKQREAEEEKNNRENARLAEIARKAEQERENAEREAREARDKIESEAKAERDAEEAKRKADVAAAKKAAKAPDREKLLAYAKAIQSVKCAELATEEGRAALNSLFGRVGALVGAITEQAETL